MRLTSLMDGKMYRERASASHASASILSMASLSSNDDFRGRICAQRDVLSFPVLIAEGRLLRFDHRNAQSLTIHEVVKRLTDRRPFDVQCAE